MGSILYIYLYFHDLINRIKIAYRTESDAILKLIQLNINMSLLTAGKQISVGGDKVYGRGLFIADPEQAERKARKQMEYQQQLRSQMEEAKRRKDDQKRKEMEEDIRLQQKINQEIKKEQDRKNDKGAPKNDKNFTQPPPPPARSQLIKTEVQREQPKERRHQEPQNYKFEFRQNTETDRGGENPYLPKRFDPMQAEEERFYDESNNQRLKGMREALEEKMSEVYKKIKQSQDLEIDKQIDLIRKKIASSNNSYDGQNPKVQEFQGEISYFYKIPKKVNTYADSRAMVKNLNYDSTNYVKRAQKQDFKPVTQQKLEASRQIASRESRESNDEKLWGVKKGKGNYLSNRQAMDFQINSIMGKIDGLLDQQNYK